MRRFSLPFLIGQIRGAAKLHSSQPKKEPLSKPTVSGKHAQMVEKDVGPLTGSDSVSL